MADSKPFGVQAELFPSGNALSRLYFDLVNRWHTLSPPLVWAAAVEQLPPSRGGLEAQIEHLGLVNCFQWHLEDACRDHYDDEPLLGRLKYQIDRSNRRRVLAIDAIDETVVARLGQAKPAAPVSRLALVTPGALLDRLVILALKRYHAPERADAAGVLPLLEEQIADLCQGIDQTMEALFLGQLRLKFYRTVKLYGTNPEREAEG